MNQINKNLLLFSLLASFLGISTFFLLYKVLPIFFLHTVYYCQQVFHTYSLQIPPQMTFLLVSLTGLFFISFIIKITYTIWTQYSYRQNLDKKSIVYPRIQPLLKRMGLEKKVSVIDSMQPLAFCLGLRSPHIYLSTQTIAIMDSAELEAILWHEKHHIDHKDSLTMFIASVSQFFFPFFPMITDLLQHYKIDREIQADKRAIQELGTKKPLVSVLKKLLQNPTPSLLFASAIGDNLTLELRIKSLLQVKLFFPRIKKGNMILSAFSVGLLIATIAIPVHATEVHTNRQDSMMVCLEGNNCASWCTKHNTIVPYSSAENASHIYPSVK